MSTATFPQTTRMAYRDAVAHVAALAKAKLPQAVNGRVGSAVKLVLQGDVFPQPDGTILVGSSSDAMKSYVLIGAACECQDFVYGKAPEGWCQHRIAAGIAKRVGELLPVVPPVETAPASPSPTAPPALPEAPASCNVYVQIGGHKVQVTLRDSDESRMLARLGTLLAQYPAPEAPTQGQPSQAADATPQCPAHGALKASTKGKGWYCPTKLSDDTWCQHKAK